jgi:hypothetical protein
MTDLIRRHFSGTDVARWSNLVNHDPLWNYRTRQIAELVPSAARVIEFGAGRRQLEKLLSPGCTYVPSDLVSRGPGTMVCDLNVRPLPDLSEFRPDVAVFGGVLEYLKDLRSLSIWLARHVTTLIASYECAVSRPKTIRRLIESAHRAREGLVNTYNEEELKAVFAEFLLTRVVAFHEPDGDGRIFVFRKKGSLAPN